MARIARVVASGYPHHVTQRGNRRQQTFFSEDDYREYLRLMSASCARSGTEVWAYCLMPNHVHLIMVPQHADGLRSAVSEAHRRFTLRINVREGWQGHLWQERFHSFLLDETHLVAAVRYVENNPVRAGLCAHAEDWPWSSARAHLRGEDDGLARVAPMLAVVANWPRVPARSDGSVSGRKNPCSHPDWAAVGRRGLRRRTGSAARAQAAAAETRPKAEIGKQRVARFFLIGTVGRVDYTVPELRISPVDGRDFLQSNKSLSNGEAGEAKGSTTVTPRQTNPFWKSWK